MHLRESRTSKFSGLRQIYPPVTLKYPLVQKLNETPGYLNNFGVKYAKFGIFANPEHLCLEGVTLALWGCS